ncbi:MAG: DUF4845 domain-containing protein [Giesbergeria sp.]|nr:DUF4845 domain-containing protein [Giesbergeria sp.]
MESTYMHRTVTRSRQRGMSFMGVIFLGLIAVSVFAVGGQSLPIFLEYQAIQKAANKAAMEGSTVPEVRASFERAGAIDNISSVRGDDLEITKNGEKIVVTFKYSREVALVGPAFLVYRFQGQSK